MTPQETLRWSNYNIFMVVKVTMYCKYRTDYVPHTNTRLWYLFIVTDFLLFYT
jgi:hypothetical protein